MKALLALTAFALLLTAACSTGDAAPAKDCATPDPSPHLTISTLAPVPEGTLLLTSSTGALVYTLDADCGAVAAAKANYISVAPDGSAAAMPQASGQYSTGLGVITSEGLRTIAEWHKTMSFGTSMAWSRDGRLAYNTPSSANEPAGVWKWDGGEPKRVFTGTDSWPLGWTADGNVIVSPRMKHLEIVDASGKSLQSTDMPFDGWAAGYVISPDEAKLAIVSQAEGDANTPPRSTGLWLYDFAADKWTKLSEFGAAVSSSPGSGLFVSTDAALAVASRRKGPPPPSWSPDSTRITYYRDYTDADQVYHNDLWLYDLRSGKDALINNDRFGYADSWSPDAKYLALRTNDPTELWLLSDNGEKTQLSKDAGFDSAGWLPDGRLIISRGSKLELYDPASGQTDELRLAGESIVGAIAYTDSVYASPSGRYVAFQVPVDGGPYAFAKKQPGVYIVDVTTNEVTRLTNTGAAYISGWLGE